MHSLNRRRRNARSEEEALAWDAPQHPQFSYATWVALAVGGVGVATNLYGANKQSKSQAATDASNRAAIEQADQSAWNQYLMQRGLYAGNAPTGTIPGMQPGAAVNTKLPLWAKMPAKTTRGFRWVTAQRR